MSREAELARALGVLEQVKLQVLGTCVPFWATTGFDSRTGLFLERCDLTGNPDRAQPTRCMVQARQIFSLCTAAKLTGDETHLDTALAGTVALQRYFISAGGDNGCTFSVHRDGRPGDSLRDVYAHAFVVLALSTACDVLNDRRLLAPIDGLMAYMERELQLPNVPGFLTDSTASASSARIQNPHMHLFEAMLSAEQTVASGENLKKADLLLSLFQTQMFSRKLGLLPETFGSCWEHQEAAENTSWEPGHQFEWTWLLNWHAQLSESEVPKEAALMFDSAISFGIGSLGVVDEVRGQQPSEQVAYRLWPQTEFLKAAAIQERLSCNALAALVKSLESLNTHFLAGAFNGGWTDRINRDGEGTSTSVPASSLYHLVMAMTEVERLKNLLSLELQRLAHSSGQTSVGF